MVSVDIIKDFKFEQIEVRMNGIFYDVSELAWSEITVFKCFIYDPKLTETPYLRQYKKIPDINWEGCSFYLTDP